MPSGNCLAGKIGWGEFVILQTLARQGKSYGLIINQEVSRIRGKKCSQGGTYTVLGRLERKKLVSSFWGDESERAEARRRYYSLTELGEEVRRTAEMELRLMVDGSPITTSSD